MIQRRVALLLVALLLISSCGISVGRHLDEFKADVTKAVEVVESYWQERFDKAGLEFKPVAHIQAFSKSGDVYCNGEAVPSNNAEYCSTGDFIAYDAVWAQRIFNKIGDAFVYFLIGHEYGHAIQTRVHIVLEFSIDIELQADCMSGAALGFANKHGLVHFDDNDIEEFEAGFGLISDDPATPWFFPTAHGTVEERINSFFAGYNDGLSSCGAVPAELLNE